MYQGSRQLLVFLFTLLLGLSSLQVVLGSSTGSSSKQVDGYRVTNALDTSELRLSVCVVNRDIEHCNEDLNHSHSSHHCATCAIDYPAAIIHSMAPTEASERLRKAEGIFKEFVNFLFRPPKT